jgi:hypothetical protein
MRVTEEEITVEETVEEIMEETAAALTMVVAVTLVVETERRQIILPRALEISLSTLLL